MNLPTEYTDGEQGAFDIPFNAYRETDGVNYSTLKLMYPTPAHVLAPRDKEEETPEMILGSLIHRAILEPEVPLSRIAIKPDGMSFATREGKAWRAQREEAGMLIVPAKDWESLGGCVKAAATNSFIRDALRGAMTEVSLFAQLPTDTLMRKARVDAVPVGNYLGDIKTVEDASPEAMRKYLADRGYARQAAWYLKLWNHLFPKDQRDTFVFFLLEKRPPYLSACYQVSTEALRIADEKNEEQFTLYQRCVNWGEWPGYPLDPQIVGFNRWTTKENL